MKVERVRIAPPITGPRGGPASRSEASPDRVEIRSVASSPADDEAARKAALLGDMIHTSDAPTRAAAIQLLSRYPLGAIERVHGFGTRVEFYGPGETLRPEMAELDRPGYLGGYNPQINVIGIKLENVNTFTVLHEFAHALDAALDHPSRSDAWVGGCERARASDRAIRENARKNPEEYLADDVAAWLIPDDWLPALVHGAQRATPDAARDRQDYSHGRLERKDPEGFLLAGALLSSVGRNGPAVA